MRCERSREGNKDTKYLASSPSVLLFRVDLKSVLQASQPDCMHVPHSFCLQPDHPSNAIHGVTNASYRVKTLCKIYVFILFQECSSRPGLYIFSFRDSRNKGACTYCYAGILWQFFHELKPQEYSLSALHNIHLRLSAHPSSTCSLAWYPSFSH